MRNQLLGLEAFMSRWDDPDSARFGVDANVVPGPNGNINDDGGSATTSASTLTRWDEEFERAIEPGVRELVLLLVDQLDCITYSSCEGHAATLDCALRERHVGLLPRSSAECKVVRAVLDAAVERIRRTDPDVASGIHIVTGVVTDGDTSFPCVDILFPMTGSESGYLHDSEAACGALTREVCALASDGCTDPSRARLEFLERNGASHVRHSGRFVLEHLQGTAELLRRWGARPALCDAGLFHAFYGTETFDQGLAVARLDRRRTLRRVIGGEAERLVFLFAMKSGERLLSVAAQLARASVRHDPAPGIYDLSRGREVRVKQHTFRDLVLLSVANAVEQIIRVPAHYDPADRRRLWDVAPLLPPAAINDLAAALRGAER